MDEKDKKAVERLRELGNNVIPRNETVLDIACAIETYGYMGDGEIIELVELMHQYLSVADELKRIIFGMEVSKDDA